MADVDQMYGQRLETAGAIERRISLRPQDHSLILKFERGEPQVHLGGVKDAPRGLVLQSNKNNGRELVWSISTSQGPHNRCVGGRLR
jgi:hypothetical protein